MAGKYFTQEDIRKMMTEKVKDYLDQGWYFNFKYMRCSNGYEFAAVTDGKDTVVIYIDFYRKFNGTYDLNAEKFIDSNNEFENIWLHEGRGELIESTRFFYKPKTETYVIINDYDEKKRVEKKFERSEMRSDYDYKDISQKMKEVIANFIKKQGITGLKRFKVSDMYYGCHHPHLDEYLIKIKNFNVRIHRGDWEVTVF